MLNRVQVQTTNRKTPTLLMPTQDTESISPGATEPGSHPVAVGDRLTVTVTDVAFGGEGVARQGDFVVFVPFTGLGESVEVEIREVKKRFPGPDSDGFSRLHRLELRRAALTLAFAAGVSINISTTIRN